MTSSEFIFDASLSKRDDDSIIKYSQHEGTVIDWLFLG